jgi:DNA-binding winged helix-turn-helix (wHTH) protein
LKRARGAKLRRFSDFVLDLETGELRSGRGAVPIADKPLAVLLALLETPGGLVTREELRQRLWPEALAADFDNSLNAAGMVSEVRSPLDPRADRSPTRRNVTSGT